MVQTARWPSLRSVLKIALLAGLLFGAPAAAEPPNVVVSIMPVQSLVAGVMQGVAAPSRLMRFAGIRRRADTTLIIRKQSLP